MKIIDLIEATNPWKPIAQQPNGNNIINSLLSDNTAISGVPHSAGIQELTGTKKQTIDPETMHDGEKFIYIVMGVPIMKRGAPAATDYLIMPKRNTTEYGVYEVQDKSHIDLMGTYSRQGIEKNFINYSKHTWLVTWEENARSRVEDEREIRKELPSTPRDLITRLAPLKLSIITRAAIQLKRSNPNAMELVTAIRNAMRNNKFGTKIIDGRNPIHPVEVLLNIDAWWMSRMKSVLQDNTVGGQYVPGSHIKLDYYMYPKGLFAKIPEELVKNIVKWASTSAYTVKDI